MADQFTALSTYSLLVSFTYLLILHLFLCLPIHLPVDLSISELYPLLTDALSLSLMPVVLAWARLAA